MPLSETELQPDETQYVKTVGGQILELKALTMDSDAAGGYFWADQN